MGASARGSSFGSVIQSETMTLNVTTADALTVPAGAVSALITVGANAIRYRSDGTDPTVSVGHFIAANGNVEVFGNEMDSIKLLATTSTSDTIVTYYKE